MPIASVKVKLAFRYQAAVWGLYWQEITNPDCGQAVQPEESGRGAGDTKPNALDQAAGQSGRWEPEANLKRTILLVSELGTGMGHARRLLRIGLALQQRGFDVVAAMRELWVCTNEYREAQIQVFQAPIHRGQFPSGGFRARGYADISAACGFQTVGALWSTILGWTALLELIRPQVIVADYSPIATLAAFDFCPLIAIGDGFVVPPPHLPHMPLLRAGTPMANEELQLANAASVLSRLKRRVPKSLPSLVGGQAHVVCTFPELDIYATQRLQQAHGSLVTTATLLPPPAEPRIYLYLTANSSMSLKIVEAAVATELPVEAYVRDANQHLLTSFRHKGVIVHDTPQNLVEVLRRCSLLIHHGGIGTLEVCLAAGRPQLLVPLHFEQSLNTANAVKRGIALSVLKTDTVASLAAKARDLAVTPEGLAQICEIATRLNAHPRDRAINAIVDACDSQVKLNRSPTLSPNLIIT